MAEPVWRRLLKARLMPVGAGVHAAHRRQHVAGGGIHAHQGSLQARGQALDAVRQGPLGLLLQVQVQGGGHLQAPLLHPVFPIALHQFIPDPAQVGRRQARPLGRRKPGLQLLGRAGA